MAVSTTPGEHLAGFGGVPADHYARASRAAEAILYDGYLLRPASRRGVQNHRPRRAGVLAPRDWATENLPLDTGVDGSVESWFARTEVVAEGLRLTQTTAWSRHEVLLRRRASTG